MAAAYTRGLRARRSQNVVAVRQAAFRSNSHSRREAGLQPWSLPVGAAGRPVPFCPEGENREEQVMVRAGCRSVRRGAGRARAVVWSFHQLQRLDLRVGLL